MNPPRVLAAAVRLGTGVVCFELPPARHHTVVHKLHAEGHRQQQADEQGFILDDGRFVSREEAVGIAQRCGQIEEPKWPPKLYSEDLW